MPRHVHQQKLEEMENIIVDRNKKITALKMSMNPNSTHYSKFLNPNRRMMFDEQFLLSNGLSQNKNKIRIPRLLKKYPDLFSDNLAKSSKAKFWRSTEAKLNELFLEPSLTQQQKFSVVKKFMYKVLKEKHLLSQFFKKDRLKKIKRKAVRLGG